MSRVRARNTSRWRADCTNPSRCSGRRSISARTICNSYRRRSADDSVSIRDRIRAPPPNCSIRRGSLSRRCLSIEYAIAKLWVSWGIEPTAMIGHSVGELAAACIAGVFSLEAGLQIIAERGRLIQSMPTGSMTAVPIPEREVLPLLNGKLSLASVNCDDQCVVSGPDCAIGDLEKSLAAKGMEYHRLRVSHAFHSSMMDPILRRVCRFRAQVRARAATHSLHFERDRELDHRCRSDRSQLLGGTAAPDGAIRRRYRRCAENSATRFFWKSARAIR